MFRGLRDLCRIFAFHSNPFCFAFLNIFGLRKRLFAFFRVAPIFFFFCFFHRLFLA